MRQTEVSNNILEGCLVKSFKLIVNVFYRITYLKKSWINVTEKGNKYFQQEQFSISKSWFEQAMQIAELLFRHAQDADSCGMPVVSAFNVSCINLAKNFREIEDIKTAELWRL
jgi:hypothetical protein